MTYRERILRVMRGEMVDMIPYVPRLDLWWIANKLKGTLPKEYEEMEPDQIACDRGWACYHIVPDALHMLGVPQAMLHGALGLLSLKQSPVGWRFSSHIEVQDKDLEGQKIIEYHTPEGVVRGAVGMSDKMKKAGTSVGWLKEPIIKDVADYRVVGCLFENIELFPQYEATQEFIDQIGESGVFAAPSLTGGICASPMHHIQKAFLDATQFFYEYKDHHEEMRELAERMEPHYDKMLEIMADSPAEVVLWGANYDDMLTYPPYFKAEILPWLRKASETFKAKGKIVISHTDGENRGLMDLIRDCGVDVAESVTPYPMTKVKVEEYYRRWKDKLTIMGGIPECILLEETASQQEFEAFLDNLFNSLVPGDRLILGIGDSTPPNAVFDRLVRIGERIEQEGRLPLEAGGARAVSQVQMVEAEARVGRRTAFSEAFKDIQEDVIKGDQEALKVHVEDLLSRSVSPHDILHRGLIPAMETIGEEFKAGKAFIPEVLLSARAMNDALLILEPHLGGEKMGPVYKVLIGTVQGDLHDIGKNMVSAMLRGVGFIVEDFGIDVPTDEFVKAVETHEPHILALSALLTTTMPEMKNIIDNLGAKNLRSKIKIMVGGAPVNQKFSDDIGADGYADDAGGAVDLAKDLVGGPAAGTNT